METLILVADIAALAVMLYYSIKNERHVDKTETGPFRIKNLPVRNSDIDTAPNINKKRARGKF